MAGRNSRWYTSSFMSLLYPVLTHPHGSLRERALDPLAVERFLQAGPQLPHAPPLLRRLGLHHEADGDAVGAEGLDAPHLGLLEDAGAEVLVLPYAVCDGLDDR